MLKADRYVKLYGLVKRCSKYWLIKKFKMDLMNLSINKDPNINKYSIFMLGKHNFVLSMHFLHCYFNFILIMFLIFVIKD